MCHNPSSCRELPYLGTAADHHFIEGHECDGRDGKLSLSSCFPARKLDICFHVSLISIKNAAAETNDDTEAERIKDSSPRPSQGPPS